MKHTFPFLFIFLIGLFGCNSGGSYEYSQYEELDRAYRVLKGQENRKWAGSSISSQRLSADKYMEEYLQSFSRMSLSTPVQETQRDSLYEDWGIYEKNSDNSEDTLFYVHLAPKISRIGEDVDEIWVVESVLCNWWKSWRIRGYDLRPFVKLRYINKNDESDNRAGQIMSDFMLQILIDQSTSAYIKQSWISGGGAMDSKSRHWIDWGHTSSLDGISEALPPSIDVERQDLTQLIDEDWEIRSRGNVFQGLNR